MEKEDEEHILQDYSRRCYFDWTRLKFREEWFSTRIARDTTRGGIEYLIYLNL